MKKVMIFFFMVSLFIIFTKKDNDIIIPNTAIRFRVIANSNSVEDQQEKMIIKEKLEKEVYELISNANSTNEVRNVLNDNLDEIKSIIDSYGVPYNIDFGYNYFPTKNYKGVLYEAGNYESLVVTLGEGAGNNFWCVLFPPLCLLDNESEDTSEVEYQFYVKKLLDRF